MRARWLKPDFFTDKKIATMSPETALVFQALWVWADDGGVCICDPDYLKSQAFHRWQIFTIDVITRSIRELSDLKRIAIYRIGDDYFAQVRHWSRHQAVHKPSKFRHPRPDEQLTFAKDDFPGTLSILVPHQSQIRQLDSKTARQLDGEEGVSELSRNSGPKSVDVAATAPPPPPSLPPVHLGKTAGERTLASKLPSDLDRLALTAICAIVPAPASWVAEASAALDGMHGKVTTPLQLGIALREFVGSGHHLEHPPSFKLFRRFIENATNGAGTAGNGTASASDAAGKGPTAGTGSGEAGSILARIKGFAEKVTPQAGGAVQVLRRDRVAELGADVLAAFDAVGGAEAVLKTPGEKWGFFIRDFSSALAYARQNGVPDA